jgi:hypothetical protein
MLGLGRKLFGMICYRNFVTVTINMAKKNMNTTQPPHLEAILQNMAVFRQYLTEYTAEDATVGDSVSQIFPNISTSLAQAMAQYSLPTLELADLDKHLNDLKIVLKFMETNTTLLRQSLDALELQRKNRLLSP